MPTVVLLTYYCALILVASIVGGMIPVWFQLTHRWMQFAVSFVAGVMLGVGVLHMLPHAVGEAMTASSSAAEAVDGALLSFLAGVLAMFFIERFFSYHYHDVPEDHALDGEAIPAHPHDAHQGEQVHGLSWSGAALGLALHSILNGVAMAAAVQHGTSSSWLAGFGTFLVVVLHKPFDAMTIGMLMARGGWSLPWRHSINVLFSLAVPVGVLLFYFGLMSESAGASPAPQQWFVACALAFSAGTFVCISLTDLLPELQFHRHDRVKLSVALILGLAVAHAASWLETMAHSAHAHSAAPRISNLNRSEFELAIDPLKT
jgi:zinc and cadmium transporter